MFLHWLFTLVLLGQVCGQDVSGVGNLGFHPSLCCVCVCVFLGHLPATVKWKETSATRHFVLLRLSTLFPHQEMESLPNIV